MLEWLGTAAVLLVIAAAVLHYFDLFDPIADLVSSIFKLIVAAVALTVTLLARGLDALRRLVQGRQT
jgi:hypothetical protein